MAPTTPVRGTATSMNDAPIVPRRGRPTKPTDKIREVQVNLGLRTVGTRAATQRTILPAITVAPANDQQSDDGPRNDAPASEGTNQPTQNMELQGTPVEVLKGYRAVIQALSGELKEAQKDRQIQTMIIQDLRGKIQNIGSEVKEVGEEARRMGEMVKIAGEEAKAGWDEARKGWEEVKRAREEAQLAREETQLAREAAKAAEEKVVTLQNEMGAMKEEFGATLQKLSADLSTWSSQPPSWASVAARGVTLATSPRIGTPNSSQDTGPSVSPFSSVSQEKAAGLMGVGLELGAIQEPPFNIQSIAAVKLRLRQAFDSHPATTTVPITGISRKGKEGTSYRIRVGNEENVRKVKEHREWIASHFEGAKIKEDTEYLVVVDGVDKETICDESKTKIRRTAHEEIGKENNISISKIRFLAGGNPGGNKCSVIIHMPDKREADHITSKQYMEFGDEMVFTRKFMPGTGFQRCFKCQRFGRHRARDCPNQEATCEKCGLDGHKADGCDSDTTKCVNCSGSHMASDRRCPAFARARQESGQPLNV